MIIYIILDLQWVNVMSNDEIYNFLFINDVVPKIPNKFAALCGCTCLPPDLVTFYVGTNDGITIVKRYNIMS
jgi:hypothetical protein